MIVNTIHCNKYTFKKRRGSSGIWWALTSPWKSGGEGVNLLQGRTHIHSRSPRWTASGMLEQYFPGSTSGKEPPPMQDT